MLAPATPFHKSRANHAYTYIHTYVVARPAVRVALRPDIPRARRKARGGLASHLDARPRADSPDLIDKRGPRRSRLALRASLGRCRRGIGGARRRRIGGARRRRIGGALRRRLFGACQRCINGATGALRRCICGAWRWITGAHRHYIHALRWILHPHPSIHPLPLRLPRTLSSSAPHRWGSSAPPLWSLSALHHWGHWGSSALHLCSLALDHWGSSALHPCPQTGALFLCACPDRCRRGVGGARRRLICGAGRRGIGGAHRRHIGGARPKCPCARQACLKASPWAHQACLRACAQRGAQRACAAQHSLADHQDGRQHHLADHANHALHVRHVALRGLRFASLAPKGLTGKG